MRFLPMLASLADPPLEGAGLVYEPKYDGIRAIADVDVPPRARLWSRLGNEKTAQFPEIVAALEKWGRGLKEPVVLDGEVVALDDQGEPAGFQNLQGRIHLGSPDSRPSRASRPSRLTRPTSPSPTAYIVFDLLREGKTDYRSRPLSERRARLEKLLRRSASPLLRVSHQIRGDGHKLYDEAISKGWEGLIVKDAASLYHSGKRTPDWRKKKILLEQEFVVAGWTEPRQTRAYFGALLLGVYEGGDLIYVGHTGTGFNERELSRVMKLLKPIETTECPFRMRPAANEKPHWVKAKLVAQVRFTEWTADGKLRQPVYLGLRDDKNPREVVRENREPETVEPRTRYPEPGTRNLLDQLQSLEDAGRDGTIDLPDGSRLAVTNLRKIFWPRQKFTKGDLFRYYVTVAPFILPAVADRPLVMKRFPNGIDAKPFYQHRAESPPKGVRIENVTVDQTRPQIIGGSLTTLLYMAQLAAISQDPWFSRVQSPEFADYAALDLDPPSGVPFDRVLDVARWIRDELGLLGVEGFPKTSGADGLHIYVRLPPKTPYEAGQIFCQIIATVVAQKHPKAATVERSVAARGQRVYVDYLQNILGKTLATAYSARASEYAGVSTPLTWKEIDSGVEREAFTIATMPDRVKRVGDVWAPLMTSKGVDLSKIARYAERGGRVEPPAETRPGPKRPGRLR